MLPLSGPSCLHHQGTMIGDASVKCALSVPCVLHPEIHVALSTFCAILGTSMPEMVSLLAGAPHCTKGHCFTSLSEQTCMDRTCCAELPSLAL